MIDVSNHQGVIDWHSVAEAGHERAYIKLTEGVSFIDPFALTNIHHARAVGITPGWYHFARPENDPLAEAAFFLRVAHGHMLPGDLPPALDLEEMGGRSLTQLAWWKGTWFKPVDAAIGCRAVFYSYRSMITVMEKSLFPDRPIWGAAPGATLTPEQFARWSFHQDTFQGRVPGIVGNVDESRVLHPDAVPAIPAAGV